MQVDRQAVHRRHLQLRILRADHISHQRRQHLLTRRPRQIACKVAAHAAQRPLLQLGLHGGGRRAWHGTERVAAQIDLLLAGLVLRDVELLPGRAKRVGLVQPRCKLGRVDGVAGGLGGGVEPLGGRGVLVAARVPVGHGHGLLGFGVESTACGWLASKLGVKKRTRAYG